jgi:hypothetical protein
MKKGTQTSSNMKRFIDPRRSRGIIHKRLMATLTLLVVVCLLSGAWGTTESGAAATRMASQSQQGWQFQFRDALTDNVVSDGLGPYTAPSTSTCDFSVSTRPSLCQRTVQVTGCATGDGLPHHFYMTFRPVGKCFNQMKVGQTASAEGFIGLDDYDPACSTSVHIETLRARSPAPTITRTGQATWRVDAQNAGFDREPNGPPVERCLLTFQLTMTKVRL